MTLRLGVNIDHVATLRQARGGSQPDPVHAAVIVEQAGADGITLHVREDRRHVQERDLRVIAEAVAVPVNLELSVDPAGVALAAAVRPANVCLVPEHRQELTTEGGLDVRGTLSRVSEVVSELREAGIQVQLFVDPVAAQIEASAEAGAQGVEIHTGAYANARGDEVRRELDCTRESVQLAQRLGLRAHAGHGLDYRNVGAIAAIAGIEELNIGHSIISRAVFVGLSRAVQEMKSSMRRGSGID